MLEIRLLGRFEVRRDGQPVAIPSRAAQSLLAYLLLNPSAVHRREKLAGVLAPDSTDENARSTLRHALWRLRKALATDTATGYDYFLADELGVGLDPAAAYVLDVNTLSACSAPDAGLPGLIRGVSVYGGELLPGFYEDWVLLERRRLAALYESVMHRLLDGLTGAGRWEDVITWAERWIAVGETPEAAYRALMVAHAVRGDTGRAASAYSRCVDALHNDLGVEPAQATRELYEHLAKGEVVPGLVKVNRAAVLPGATAAGTPLPEDGARSLDAPEPGEPPFKGLKCFDAADAGLFFGREALIGQLVGRLYERTSLIVVGASGSGKSSVLRAGLLPALMAGAERGHDGAHPVADSQARHFHLITPTSHPLQALALSLTRESESVTAAATLADDMVRDRRSLALYLARAALPGNGQDGRHVSIAVDQFEEVFTQCRSEEERAAFIGNLMALVPETNAGGVRAPSNVTVVLALRADFYAHCASYPELRAALANGQVYIGAMTRDELRRAIERPAEVAGWQFEPGLVDQFLHDAGDEPGNLPLVSHALLETWQRRRGRSMTFSGYASAGGVSGAIAHTAQTTYARLTPEQQAVARNIFLRLTELGEGTQDTRRRAATDEFVSDPASQPLVESVLAILVNARLITVSAQEAEVAHEALIREWPLLREWLRDDREGLLVHRRLTEAANSWVELERDAGELYRGARLVRAQEWAQAGHADLSLLEREFLEASQAAAAQEAVEKEAQRRRQLEAAQQLAAQQRRSATQMRRVAAVLAAALVLALALGGLASVLQNRARTAAQLAQYEQTLALSRELAALALANMAEDPQLGLLLALEAVNGPTQAGLEPPLEAEAALHHVLQAVQRRAMIASEAGIAVSPDGRLAAAAAEDGTVRLWSASQWTTNGQPSGDPVRVLAGAPGYHTFSFDGDHRLLADGGEDGSITLWETISGEAAGRWTGLGGPVARVALADDGSILAALGSDRRVKVWETSTGEERLSIGPAPAGIVALALSSDGSALATGDETGAVVVRNTANGEKTSTLAEQFDRIADIRFCSSGRLAVSTPATLSMWKVATGERTTDLLGLSPLAVGTFACDSDSDRVAISGMTADIKVLEAATGHELAALPDTPGAVDLGFSSDGLLLYVHTPTESIEVWESYGGGELAILPTRHGTGAVAISPDGAHVATGIDRMGGLALWDVPAEPGPTGNSSSAGPLLRIWNKWHDSAVYAVAFSPDGRQLATADSSSVVEIADVAALISPEWQAKSPTILPPSLHWGGYRVLDLTFSPDGRRLAAVTPNVLEPYRPLAIWNLGHPESGTLAEIHSWGVSLELPQWIYSTGFSPDSRHIVLGLRGGPAEVRDVEDGTLLYAVPGKDWAVNGPIFTPDGKRLITDSVEGAFNVWQLPERSAGSEASATHLFRVRAHDSSISQMVLTPDGSRLITGSTDGTVKVWETATGRPLMTLTEGAAPVLGLSLSADGERLAVASDAVRIHLLPLKNLLALANSRVTRTLSPEERETYLHEAVASIQTGTQASLAATNLPKRPQHLVRAFVNSFNRMDGFAVGSLFATEFSYNLDTLWGRSEIPITSRGTLIATIFSLSRGEGGRWSLLGCDPPRDDQTVLCHMTYISESFKALGRAPAEFDAVFSFDDDKIRSVDGAPPEDQLELAQWDMYEAFRWSRDNGHELYYRLNAMDQSPAGSWESEARLAAEAGEIWLKMYRVYAASLAAH